MHESTGSRIERLFAEGTPIDEALRKAVQAAVLRHCQAGQPIAIWQNGKVVWLEPDQVPAWKLRKNRNS